MFSIKTVGIKTYSVVLLFLIIIFYLFSVIRYAQVASPVSDEGFFYNYARNYLKGNPARMIPVNDNSKMPVIVLNTIPRIIKQKLHPGYKAKDGGVNDILQGRYITIFFSVFILLIVYQWATELYGYRSGLFAAFLMAFCPNNLSNAAFVTTDSYSVLALLSTIYLLWKSFKLKSFRYFLLFSLAISICQLVKQSLFHLYIIIPLLLAAYYFTQRPVLRIGTILKYAFAFIIINWFIINAGYYFFESNRPLSEYHFMSSKFSYLQQVLPSWLILPFPKPFITGLDMAKYYDNLGGGYSTSSFGKPTILGQSATGGSFWYYYFISILFKTPVSYFVFFVWSLIPLFGYSRIRKIFRNEVFLLLPVLYYLIVLSFFYKTQVGIRHIIFIYPFIFILSSSIMRYADTFFKKLVIGILSLFLVASVIRYRNNFYAYTNELIANKSKAYSIVGASNLEFRQSDYFYKEYLQQHRNVSWITDKPHSGITLINAEDYLDISNQHKYDWIKNVKPFGTVNYSGLLINVMESDLKK